MGLMDRIKMGLGLGTSLQRKDSLTGPLIAMRSLGRAIWSPRTYAAFAKEGYIQNVIAYRAIRLIAENVAAIPILAYEGDRELDQHPILKVLERPNPWQSGAELFDAFTAYFKIAGNAYLEAVDLDGEIRELYALRPDRMRCIPGRRGYPQAWEYSVDGSAKITFPMDAGPGKQLPIMHLREFNPLDDWYGASAFDAAAFAIDVHNSAGNYNKALLDNSAAPSGALVFKGTADSDGVLSDDQFRRLKAEMGEQYQGARNAGRPLLLDGGLEWQAMGMSPKDMEFVVSKREAAREIALAFGVPPMLLGIPGDNTYSNYAEANRAFHRQTVLPLLDKILNAITNWVQPTYAGLRLAYDEDRVEALALERAAVWDRVSAASFLTTDEKREATGYGPYAPGEGPGETILINGTMSPLEVSDFEPGGPEPDDDELPPDGDELA